MADQTELERFRAALMRIADEQDPCHHGTGGPWQDVAADALGLARNEDGRPIIER